MSTQLEEVIQEQPYYLKDSNYNSTVSVPISTETAKDEQTFEEKPYYMTNQPEENKNESDEGINKPLINEINTKQNILNEIKFERNSFSLFFLYKGIFNTLHLIICLIFAGTLEPTDQLNKTTFAAIIGGTATICSLICVIVFSVIYCNYPQISQKSSWIWLSIFFVFWILTVGWCSMRTRGQIYFLLAIVVSSDFINCIIANKWWDYIYFRAIKVLVDIGLIGIGSLIFFLVKEKINSRTITNLFINYFVLLIWVVFKGIVFKKLEHENSDNIPLFIMKYFAFWLFFFILLAIVVLQFVIVDATLK